MRYDDPNRPAPTRGIIIIDKSVVPLLSVELPDTFRASQYCSNEKKIALYLILQFLSQHGYEVIVPEIVALRVRVARNGAILDRYFGRSSLPFFEHISNFFSRIPELSGNIYIAPPPQQDNSEAARYVRSIWGIVKDNSHAMSKGLKIAAIEKTYTSDERKNFHLVAITQLIKFMKKTAAPIFYLCEDFGAATNLSHVNPDRDVYHLRLPNLYNGMRDNGLLSAVGITNIFYHDIYDHIIAVHAQAGIKLTLSHTQRSKEFQESLQGIKVDLAPMPDGSNARKVLSGSARFGKRYENISAFTKK